MNQETPISNSTEQVTETDNQIIDQLFREKKSYEDATQDWRKEIQDIYRVYSGKIDEVESAPYKSKEVIPKMRTEIGYIKPFIFSGNPEIEIEGVGDEDKTISQILEKIVNYDLSQGIDNCYDKIEDWVHQSITFGTSLMHVTWKFVTEQNGDGTETPVVDQPDLLVPNILDTFWNPLCNSVDEQKSVIFRSVMHVEDIKQIPFYNDNKLLVKPKGHTANIYDSTELESSDINSADKLKTEMGQVEVYDRITKDRIQTVVDGAERLLLRDVEKPGSMIEIVKFLYEKNTIPNRFTGLGVGHNVLGLDRLYYRMFNQMMDNVKLLNNPMFKFKKGAGVNPLHLVSKPGGGIAVNNMEDVEQLNTNDIKQGALEMVAKVEDEHKRASGGTDLVQGSASNDTLGQDQLVQANVSARFELVKRRFKQALTELAEIIIQKRIENLQSIDDPILRIFPSEVIDEQTGTPMTDEMGVPVNFRQKVFELLKNEAQNIKYNIKVKGDTIVARNKDVQIKQLIDWFNLFGQILPPENQMEAARKILELRGVDEIDKLVPDPQQYAMQIQQQQAMEASMIPQPGDQITESGINQSINSAYEGA